MTARVAQAIFRWAVDPKGSREVKNEMDEVEAALGDLRSAFFSMMEPAQDLGMLASQFEALGFEVQDYGRRMTESMTMFAEDYVDNVEEADEVSRAWVKTQQDLEDAHKRFGKVSAQQILPYMKMQKEVIELAVRFAESYPEIAKIAFGIGTAMVLATSLANAVSKGIRLYADIKMVGMESQRVLAAKMIRDSANKQLAAAVMMKQAAGQQTASGATTSVGGLAKGVIGGAGGIKGLLAAAVPMAAVAAAVVAIGAAAMKYAEFSKEVKAGTDKVVDSWMGFTSEVKDSTESASGAVYEYRQRQIQSAQALAETSKLARFVIDDQKMLNISMAGVRQMLLDSSETYEDYERGVDTWNNTLRAGETRIRKVKRATYEWNQELNRLRTAFSAGALSMREYGRALVENGDIYQKLTGLVLYSSAVMQEEHAIREDLLDSYIEYQEEIKASDERWSQARLEAVAQYGDDAEALEEETAAERLRILEEYAQGASMAELQAAFAREDAIERFGDDAVMIERDIGNQRQSAMESFMEDMAANEAQYYDDRAEAAEDFGIEVARAEQAHRIEMERMQQDSLMRQTELIGARDAMALAREVADYELSRGRAEQDYGIDAQQRSEDYARQMAQMEEAFAEQQAARQAAYDEEIKQLNQQQAEMDADRQKALDMEQAQIEEARVNEQRGLYDAKEQELEDLEEAHEDQEKELNKTLKTQLADATRAHNDEITEGRRAWKTKLRDAGFYNDKEYREYQRFRQASLVELRRFVNDANLALRGLKVPDYNDPDDFKALGGYADYGIYRMGESGSEYVLNAGTTKAAERLMGGRLSQQNVLGAMGAGGSSQATAYVNLTFPGANLDENKVGQIAYERTLKALNDVMDGVT
jgi:hypothetical protein